MIDINLKYQAALFGSWEEIVPNSEVLIYFIDKFSDKGLIPANFQEIGPFGITSRLNLKSSDEVWNVTFGSTRIDIYQTNQNIGITEMGDLKTFIDETMKISEIILSKYPKKLNRMALVTRYLSKEMSTKEMDLIFNKLITTVDTYKDIQKSGWTNRVAARMDKKIQDKMELCNIISVVKKLSGKIKIEGKDVLQERIDIQFDINTFQENNEYRFDSKDILSFLNEAYLCDNDLTESYLKLLEIK